MNNTTSISAQVSLHQVLVAIEYLSVNYPADRLDPTFAARLHDAAHMLTTRMHRFSEALAAVATQSKLPTTRIDFMSRVCQAPIGSDDICGLPQNSQIHDAIHPNSGRHDFVAEEIAKMSGHPSEE